MPVYPTGAFSQPASDYRPELLASVRQGQAQAVCLGLFRLSWFPALNSFRSHLILSLTGEA